MKLFTGFLKSSRLAYLLFIEIVISIILSISSLVIFLKISTEVLEKETLEFDRVISSFVYSFRNEQMTLLMLSITFLGSTLFFLIITLFMVLYIYSIRKKDVFIYVSILYTGVILNLLLKYIFQRPRPEFPLVYESSYSFPSGHAMISFVLYVTLSYFIYRESKNLKLTVLISIISIFLIILIGLSRIYLGVHFPTDVLAGYIAGFFWFISAILFERVIIFKRLYKRNKK